MEYSGKQCLHADFIIYDMIQPLERLLKVASNVRSLSSRVCVCVFAIQLEVYLPAVVS
jgi:hypothetical protein